MAYVLKKSFVEILNGRQFNIGRPRFVQWSADARESGLLHFVRVANTIETHLVGIVEYIHTLFTNAGTEGLNRKVRTLTRRTFGYHDAPALMAFIHFCCGAFKSYPCLDARIDIS